MSIFCRNYWWTLALVVSGSPTAIGQTISNGDYAVRIDRIGLIFGLPATGLFTTYGPHVRLEQKMAEYFGVAFNTPGGAVSAVGVGKQPDYARRTPVTYVRSNFTSDSGVTVGQVGNLEIEHTFSFDDATRCFVIGVVLRNTGDTQIRNVVYSREWRGPGMRSGTFPADLEDALPDAPDEVWRMAWMPNNLLPHASQGCVLALIPPPPSGFSPTIDDVPLRLWTNPNWPTGLIFGNTNGISFGDYDHDGWTDVVVANGAKLWRNLEGTDWVLASDLSGYFPQGSTRYGCAIADYDDDQRPDIGTEPRVFGFDDCLHLLHNLGDATFDDVADDPNILDVQPCDSDTETNSVADVDGDGYLDWFIPTYPDWLGGPGNWFLHNQGPDLNGTYTLKERSKPAGLDNPPLPVNRPEGTEFVDVDADGDVDLYSNNTLYRNLSTPGSPLFEAMTELGSGVIFSDILDEGAGFLDFDMDGDLDLCIAFCDAGVGVRMFESRGDGTFAVLPKATFDSPSTGLCLGLSFEDWDNDGDVDVSTSEVFRRNQWIEAGARHFTVATHSIPPNHITDATPAWGDFDHDGDLDSALGNWFEKGRLYENYLYDATTPMEERRYIRVRVVRDSDEFDDGLETEFGAQVTVTPHGHPTDSFKRTKVVSSSAGYLNQNEYVLHFALPVDPDPDPQIDLSLDLAVDFKGAASQGTMRIDRHVNPVLGEVDLAELENREIVIYRSGRVKIDGCDFRPAIPVEPLTTCNGGLVLAGIDTPIQPPFPVPTGSWFLGTEFSTQGALVPLRVEELILDGATAAAFDCNGVKANVFVWDVTDPANPVIAQGGLRSYTTGGRNYRSYLPIDVTFQPGRIYRVVAHMRTHRETAIVGPVTDGPITTNGGLFYRDSSACDGVAVAAAIVDPTVMSFSIRFREEPIGSFADLAMGLAGTYGVPRIVGSGDLRPGETVTVALDQALENAAVFLVYGTTTTCLQFGDGALVPSVDVVLTGTSTDSTGGASFSDCFGSDVIPGDSFFVQLVIVDPVAVGGFSISNALAATTPW